MVEIRYGDQYEIADLAGQTITEARERFQAGFGIPDKARAHLNGSKVRGGAEFDTVLNDDDRLSFTVAKSKGAYLVGALLLALALTGGVFAFGFINATTSLSGSIVESNFADVYVSPEASTLTWSGYGFYKGAIDAGTDGTGLFDIAPYTSYTGDLVVSVSIANADQLAKRYRVFALKLDLINATDGTTIDINEDNVADPNADWVLLTLNNGTVDMFPDGSVDNMTIRVKNGFYITHIRPFGGWEGSASPDLICEIAQR